MTTTTESFCEKDTFEYAKKLASEAKKGGVYALNGPLGAGKTAFAKGFAKGLGIDEPVVSPTFTLVSIYESGKMPLYHFDVYRISDISEMDETGFEDYIYGDGVTLIEWADLIGPILPGDTIKIQITGDLSKGDSYRKITVEDLTNEHNSD